MAALVRRDRSSSAAFHAAGARRRMVVRSYASSAVAQHEVVVAPSGGELAGQQERAKLADDGHVAPGGARSCRRPARPRCVPAAPTRIRRLEVGVGPAQRAQLAHPQPRVERRRPSARSSGSAATSELPRPARRRARGGRCAAAPQGLARAEGDQRRALTVRSQMRRSGSSALRMVLPASFRAGGGSTRPCTSARRRSERRLGPSVGSTWRVRRTRSRAAGRRSARRCGSARARPWLRR